MRKDLGSKTWCMPLPVAILGTYDENGVPNAMNAAWASIYDTGKVFVSLGEHKTTDNFKVTGAFTMSFATKSTLAASDYFGIASHPDVLPGQEIGNYPPLSEEQYRNRMILREAMLRHGFKPYDCEWWHFTLANEPFPDTYFNFPIATP